MPAMNSIRAVGFHAVSPILFSLLIGLTPALPAAPRGTPVASSQTKLDRQIEALLTAPEAAQAHWGISVTTLDGRVVYAKNDAQLFAPASDAKLCTTAAALALLGPAATTATRVLTSQPVDAAGVLHGDLILQGNGDASLSGRVYPYHLHTERSDVPLATLEALADQVVQRGLRSISGNIIGDDTAFPFERYGYGWIWDDLEWGYGAPISALTVNDNVVYLNVFPGAHPGDPVTALWNPDTAYYTVENTARTSTAGAQPSLGVDRQPGSKTVRIFGTVPAEGTGVHLALAIEDPAEFAAIAFRQMLAQRGVQVTGDAVARHRWPIDTSHFEAEQRVPVTLPKASPVAAPLPPANAAGMVLATHSSVPLLEDITVTNKASQNLHAELMLRLLGKQYGADGSLVEGTRVIRQFLINAGVAPEDFFLYDGSGMSTQDVVTPRALTQLLRYAAAQPWGTEFRGTLPVGGVDGSLAGRFFHRPLKGRIFAKTGTLREANSLSGYVVARSGRMLAFSILCDAHRPNVVDTTQTIDAIVAAIAAAN
jgi:D-alanyl-D-alanine carboxypeptidase/D-alanyl-D-alanine-endopeptidase (penicillin-binding protein 4)